MEPGERGRWGGVEVLDASGVRAYEAGRQDPHEAREAHETDPVLVEQTPERLVVRGSVAEVLRVQPDRGHAVLPRVLERRRPLPVGHDDHDARGKAGTRARLENGLEVRTAARGEDAEAERRRPGRHATTSTPRSPATPSPASRRTPVARSASLGGRTIT